MATNTWTNGFNNFDWFTAGNWSAAHVPRSDEDVSFLDYVSGGSTQFVIFNPNAAVTVNSLSLSNGNGLAVSSGTLAVTGALSLSFITSTVKARLTIASGSTVTAANTTLQHGIIDVKGGTLSTAAISIGFGGGIGSLSVRTGGTVN